MATITFTSPHSTQTVVVAAPDPEAPTLLAIARDHGVPIPFNCTFGGCGACLVRVTEKTGDRTPSRLGEDEEWLLDAMGKLRPEDTGFAESGGRIERYRLACQYVILGDEDIVVAYDDSLGGR